MRAVAALVACSAAYGASVGLLYGPLQVVRNLAKLPLLLVGTGLVCGLTYHLAARWLTNSLRFADVQRMVGLLYRDTAVLLASLATVNVFLALTMDAPSSRHTLNDYPLFLGINILFVGVCGTVALVRQARVMLTQVDFGRASLIISGWLAISLVVGGQWAFYLRPIFGIAAIESSRAESPFCEGNRPDVWGATNFFEVVVHLFDRPMARLDPRGPEA